MEQEMLRHQLLVSEPTAAYAEPSRVEEEEVLQDPTEM